MSEDSYPRHHSHPTTHSTRVASGKIYAAKRTKAYKALVATMDNLANAHPERYHRILSIYLPNSDLNGRSSQHAQLSTAAAFVQFQTALLLNMDHETFEMNLNRLRQQRVDNGIHPLPIPPQSATASLEPSNEPCMNRASTDHIAPPLPSSSSSSTNILEPDIAIPHSLAYHQGYWNGTTLNDFSMHPGPFTNNPPQAYTGVNGAQLTHPLPSTIAPQQLGHSYPVPDIGDHYYPSASDSTSGDPSSSDHSSGVPNNAIYN